MTRSLQRLRMLFLSAASLTLVGLILRTLSLFFAFDRDIGYFARGAFCPVLLSAVEAVSILWFFLFFFLIKKGTLPDMLPAPGLAAVCGRSFAGVTTLAAVVVLLWNANRLVAPTVIPLLAALCLLFGLVYLLFPVLGKKQLTAELFSGYALIFACALLLSVTYFDRYTQMNAPHKVGQHLALISIMPALLCELRVRIGRARPRAHAVFACVSGFLCTVVGGSNVIATIGGVYGDPVYLVIDLFLLGFGVYLATGTAGLFRQSLEEPDPDPAPEAFAPDDAPAANTDDPPQ